MGGDPDNARIPCDRRVFMTATPRLWAGKETDRLRVAMAGIEAAELIASMDDEALFGPVAHDYPLGTAISDGVIGSASALNRTVTPCSAKDSITRVTSTTGPPPLGIEQAEGYTGRYEASA
ncbi:hypothetical protein BOQ63_005610 (plasmid) [Streptomyces viridifaciens]|nr:hypothetical protein BOQ63_005610 [Streptomyces viridifaciens]